MDATFSLSQDMTGYVGRGGKLLGEQDSLVETWTAIKESGLMQLRRNTHKNRSFP